MESGDQVYRASDGGLAATHPEQQTLPVQAAPSVDGEYNTIKAAIIPYACWKVDDIRFEFDSSFVRPQIAEELKHLADLMEDHKKDGRRPPLSLFGHADPVGQDDYNKTLSGRRAKAIYALLTRRVELWEELYTQPFGGDSWKEKNAVSIMLVRLGYGDTNEEVKRFQRDQGLVEDGVVGPITRRALYRAYMDAICPVTLDPQQDFIGCGQDPGGKADYQGCGEFNPVMLFSQEEHAEFSKPENHGERNQENAPNRRVMAFLFRPGTRVNPARWPCPRAKEGQAGCRKRFWSDGEKRRTERLPQERRQYDKTKDTFTCRFYDRLADRSPCEGLGGTQVVVRLFDAFARPIPHAPYRVSSGTGKMAGEADGDGYVVLYGPWLSESVKIRWRYPPAEGPVGAEARRSATSDREDEWADNEFPFRMLVYVRIDDRDREEAVFRRLHNIGMPYQRGNDTSKRASVSSFQAAHAHRGLESTGEVDDETYQVLRDVHDHMEPN